MGCGLCVMSWTMGACGLPAGSTCQVTGFDSKPQNSALSTNSPTLFGNRPEAQYHRARCSARERVFITCLECA
jgi:hypothetical protein